MSKDEKKPEAKTEEKKAGKVVMRVSVIHNGKSLPKGSECPKDYAESMLKAGNAHVV